MALTIVAYDLNRPGQNYPELIAHLETYRKHWHAQQSVWLIESDRSEYEIAVGIEAFLDAGDKLLVSRASPSSAWTGYSETVSEWLRKYL
jgi:hypothetical protein